MIRPPQLKINDRENGRSKQEWTVQRHWQYRVHKTQGRENKKKPQKQKQNNTTQKTKNDEQQNRTDTQR
jgi:hypothetical protein